jgi:hypothetical protein
MRMQKTAFGLGLISAASLAVPTLTLTHCSVTFKTAPSGDAGSEAAVPDGGPMSGDAQSDSPTGDCTAYATAACNRESACTPEEFQTAYGSMATCVSLKAADCATSLSSAGSGITESWVTACSASDTAEAATCSGGPAIQAVPTPSDACAVVGAGAAGAACGVDSQCQSDSCIRTGTLCGACAAAGTASTACGPGTNVACARGLTCGEKNVCVPIVAVGMTCDFGVTADCVDGADCVVGDGGATTGTCQASGKAAGTACNGKGVGAPKCWNEAGFFCDPATNQCAAIAYEPAGSPCGLADGGTADDECTNGVCISGMCVAHGGPSTSCSVSSGICEDTSLCVIGPSTPGMGTCTAVNPTCPSQDAGTDEFSFQPSNVSLDVILGYAGSAVAETVAAPCSVTTDTSSPETDCFTSPIEVVQQTDPVTGLTSKLNLVVVQSVAVQALISATGPVPLVIVSLSNVSFSASGALVVDSNSTMIQVGAGGGAGGNNGGGGGPGGGFVSSSTAYVGGGGGSFCGVGGAGGGGTASAIYGSAELRPLLGGSGGGGGAVPAGAGGGAVQIVAAGQITMLAGSFISASGEAGSNSGDVCAFQNAGGGGSGGAILLEAPTVTLAGVLAANGGGGGGDTQGTDGWFTPPLSSAATPAPGGTGAPAGGQGGAGTTIGGSAGTAGVATGDCLNDTAAGAGGGGAGRIRINSSTGTATTTAGTLSPASSTVCDTQGGLRMVGGTP